MPESEKTLVLIKPDAVAAGMTGKILQTLFETGLDIVSPIKSFSPDRKQIEAHLSFYDADFEMFGNSLLAKCQKHNLDPKNYFIRKMDPPEIGKFIHHATLKYMTSGPLYAMVFQGNNAVKNVKQLCGSTFPEEAAKHSIRGMFGTDTLEKCLIEKHAIHNLVHAADSIGEAAHQIKIWFPEGTNAPPPTQYILG